MENTSYMNEVLLEKFVDMLLQQDIAVDDVRQMWSPGPTGNKNEISILTKEQEAYTIGFKAVDNELYGYARIPWSCCWRSAAEQAIHIGEKHRLEYKEENYLKRFLYRKLRTLEDEDGIDPKSILEDMKAVAPDLIKAVMEFGRIDR